MAESIMDLLVDVGILTDDRWQVVYQINLQSRGIDKEHPRTEVCINAFPTQR